MLKPANPNLPRNPSAARAAAPTAHETARESASAAPAARETAPAAAPERSEAPAAPGGAESAQLHDLADSRGDPNQANRPYTQTVRGQIQRVRLDLLARENERLDRQIQQLIDQQKDQGDKDVLWRQEWAAQRELERQRLEQERDKLEQERRLREEEHKQHARELQRIEQERQLHDQERKQREELETQLRQLGAQVERLNGDLIRQAEEAAAKSTPELRDTVKPLLMAVLELLGDSDQASADAAAALIKAHGAGPNQAPASGPGSVPPAPPAPAQPPATAVTPPAPGGRLLGKATPPDPFHTRAQPPAMAAAPPAPGESPLGKSAPLNPLHTQPPATAAAPPAPGESLLGKAAPHAPSTAAPPPTVIAGLDPATQSGGAARTVVDHSRIKSGTGLVTPGDDNRGMPSMGSFRRKKEPPAPLSSAPASPLASAAKAMAAIDALPAGRDLGRPAEPLPSVSARLRSRALPENLDDDFDEDLDSGPEKSSLDDEVAIEIARLLKPKDSGEDDEALILDPKPDAAPEESGSAAETGEKAGKVEKAEAIETAEKAEEGPLLLGTSETPALNETSEVPALPTAPARTALPKAPAAPPAGSAAASPPPPDSAKPAIPEPDKATATATAAAPNPPATPETPAMAETPATGTPATETPAADAKDVKEAEEATTPLAPRPLPSEAMVKEPLPKCLTERWDDEDGSGAAGGSDPLNDLRRDKGSFRWPFRRLRSTQQHDQSMAAMEQDKPAGEPGRKPAGPGKTSG